MTHEQLKQMGFKSKGGNDLIFEVGECEIHWWSENGWFYLESPCGMNTVYIGSNFTPDSLKQLINILKDNQ